MTEEEPRSKHGRHEWAFTAAGGGSDHGPQAIAICIKCGVVRSTTVGDRTDERIDLSGGCEGYPDRAPTRPHPTPVIG
jgi:hypothetical protein